MPLLAFKIIYIALNFNAALLIEFLINSLVSQRSKTGKEEKVTGAALGEKVGGRKCEEEHVRKSMWGSRRVGK